MKINVIEKWRSKCITHYHVIISQHLLRHFFDHINFLFLILIFNFASQNIAKKTVFFLFLNSFFFLISYLFFFSCKTTKFQGQGHKNQDRKR